MCNAHRLVWLPKAVAGPGAFACCQPQALQEGACKVINFV